jgi:sucrose-6-phosphate hydrolase SacC (GH32 family)
MFTTSTTRSGTITTPGAIYQEFVTSGYFGGLPGDPDKGASRVVTQNLAFPSYWVGKQSNGGPFEPYWDKTGAVGQYDYGSLTMARTLGSDPNQVALNGRRVLVGWIGGSKPASQSLPRDLTLSQDYDLLQQFVPELQSLRADHQDVADLWNTLLPGSMQLEVLASFTFSAKHTPKTPFGVEVLRSDPDNGATRLQIDCQKPAPICTVGVDATAQGNKKKGMGPLQPELRTSNYELRTSNDENETVTVNLHAIIDHSIVEAIWNNRTAMVVYAEPKAETNTNVMLFGGDASIKARLQTWKLNGIGEYAANTDSVV